MRNTFQRGKKTMRRMGILALVLIVIISAIFIKIDMNKKLRYSEETFQIVPQSKKLSRADVVTLSQGWDTSKVKIVNDDDDVPVPVPLGYTASSVTGETRIDTGFVIYKNIPGFTGEVNDSNADQNQRVRDQYVWVPVYDPKTIYGIDANGIMHGKIYTFSSSGRAALNWRENNGVMSITNSTGNREPLKEALSGSEVPDFLSQEAIRYNEAFYKMVKSVEKYGGFYIGRYETGDVKTGSVKVVKYNSNLEGLTQTTARILSQNLNTGAIDEEGNAVDVVTTDLIFGCLFDATLEWLAESGGKTYAEIGTNSSSWGVYSGGRVSTGSLERTKANNVYDLAGNVWEWTQEASSDKYMVYRGGAYYSSVTSSPASSRVADSNGANYNGNYDRVRCSFLLIY